MPSTWNTNLTNLKNNLDLAHGSNGLGGITAGAPVLYSQFSDLNLAVSELSTLANNLNAQGWLTSWDIADGSIVNADISDTAGIAKTKVSGTAVTLADSGTVSATMLASNSVTSAKIASSAVTPAKIGSTPICRVYNSADLGVAHATDYIVSFNSYSFDPTSMHSNTTNNSRITVATAGAYLVTANVEWVYDSGGGRRIVYILKNGSIVAGDSRMMVTNASGQTGSPVTMQSISTIVSAVATDYFQVRVLQYSGSTLTLNASNNSPVFSASWIGPSS